MACLTRSRAGSCVDQFKPESVVFVLVKTPQELWKRRLGARRDNPVAINVEGAEAYVAGNWEPVSSCFAQEEVLNGEDQEAVDANLREIYDRWGRGPDGRA
jgi:hypothetical protein